MIRNKMYEGTLFEVTGNEKNIELLNELFKDTELSSEEERALIWLSSWEKSTVQNIISAIKKI